MVSSSIAPRGRQAPPYGSPLCHSPKERRPPVSSCLVLRFLHPMSTPLARALLLVVASALPASALPCCIPYPHFQQSAPAMDGVLLAEGRPAAGVPVRLAVNPEPQERGCPAGSAETTTDAQGRFYFPAPRSFSAAISAGDRRDGWRLCILGDAGGVWEEPPGVWGGPQGQRYTCELGRPGGLSRALLPLPSIGGALAQRGCWVRRLSQPPQPPAP
jgi:hypothetical protein